MSRIQEHACHISGSSYLHDFKYKRRVLEVVLEREVNLADIFGWFRIVNVHVHQRDRSVLEEGHLKTYGESER